MGEDCTFHEEEVLEKEGQTVIVIIILAIVFLLMLTAPFFIAYIYVTKKDTTPLNIRQGKVKDPRYFGKSFAAKVEENLEKSEKETIHLSKNEYFVDGDKRIIEAEEVNRIIICRHEDFIAQEEVKTFNKEIYGACNVAFLNKDVSVRAAYAKKMMVLGAGVLVERWVDAEETLAIYDNCVLGMSASAGRRMSLGKGCSFRRLYAPEILAGRYPGTGEEEVKRSVPPISKADTPPEIVRNIKVIDKEYTNDKNEANITLFAIDDVTVLENIIVKGDITTEQSVRICDNAVVCGNIFAEHDIRIGTGAIVLGNIFTQGNVYIESGAMIGRPGSIVSVIAREEITIEKDVILHGFVSCEKIGRILNSMQVWDGVQYSYLPLPQVRTSLVLEDWESYEKLGEHGVRNDDFLTTASIMLPLKEISDSTFYGCKALATVTLPPEIEKIGNYTFTECESLAELTALSGLALREIGTSAFENCRLLPEVSFPASLERLGNAAFAGCEGLKQVTFAQGCALTEIGNHCFKDCKNVTEILLPEGVMQIGMSAFAGCDSLQKLRVPRTCETQPGIAELKDSGIEITFSE